MNAVRPRAVIVGCGYVGQRLALALRDSTDTIATTRTETSCAKLRALGISACVLDLDAVTSETWPLASTQIDRALIFYFAPPPPEGLSDTRLDRFLRRMHGKPEAIIYMSTTGVYGDRRGDEVDESTPVDPQTERAQRRMSAEHMTRVWCTEREVRRVVLRVPGIYGPERIALARLQRREPFIRAEEAGVTNRIHVDDLVAACIAVAERADARGVYNVTDGNSMSATEFMRRVAAIAHAPAPVEISREEAAHVMSAERLSFLDESRRVSNRRLLDELGLQLRYADVEVGIRACLQSLPVDPA